MFEVLLSELGPWCLAEQDFCVRFFNLDADSKEVDTTAAMQLTPDKGSPLKPSSSAKQSVPFFGNSIPQLLYSHP